LKINRGGAKTLRGAFEMDGVEGRGGAVDMVCCVGLGELDWEGLEVLDGLEFVGEAAEAVFE
jgi:hypothetical protein